MSKKYINTIIKKLKCSKGKKEEIRLLLATEFAAELEAGETPEQIKKRMGSAAEIAEEFNGSFSGEELKKYKQEKWIKGSLLFLVLLVVLGGVIYWAVPKTKMLENSKIFNRETLQTRSEEVIHLLDNRNYTELQDFSTEVMKPYLEADYMEEMKSLLGTDWGELERLKSNYMIEITERGITRAIVEMNAAYENKNIIYILCFNQEMKLDGLWMR